MGTHYHHGIFINCFNLCLLQHSTHIMHFIKKHYYNRNRNWKPLFIFFSLSNSIPLESTNQSALQMTCFCFCLGWSNKIINKSLVMVVSAHYCLSLNNHLFSDFNKIFQLCILHLFYLMTLFHSKSSSHLYRAAAYAVWQNQYFVVFQSKYRILLWLGAAG